MFENLIRNEIAKLQRLPIGIPLTSSQRTLLNRLDRYANPEEHADIYDLLHEIGSK